jgi:hypothetical protein
VGLSSRPQFQLTVNVVAILLAFLGACIINESPITSVQVCMQDSPLAVIGS